MDLYGSRPDYFSAAGRAPEIAGVFVVLGEARMLTATLGRVHPLGMNRLEVMTDSSASTSGTGCPVCCSA